MKIIKEGKLPVVSSEAFIGTCKNCGAVIEVAPNELDKFGMALCPTKGCNLYILLTKRIIKETL